VYLQSQIYLAQNYHTVALTAFLISLPRLARQASKFKYSLFSRQALKTNKELNALLQEKAAREKELWLRVHVIGICPVKHYFRVIHKPLFSRAASPSIPASSAKLDK